MWQEKRTIILALFVLAACSGASEHPRETGDVKIDDRQKGPCDDDSLPTCPMVAPTCGGGTILAVRGGCFGYVNPDTCKELGE